MTPRVVEPTYVDLAQAARWRATGAWRDLTLGDQLRSTAQRRPSALAIADGDVRLTFGELDAVASKVAGALAGAGVAEGNVVTYQLPSWWEAVVISMAAMRLGAVANPLLPNLRHHEVGFVLEEARPALVLCAASFRGFDHVAMFRALGVDPVVVRAAAPPSSADRSFEGLLRGDPLPPRPVDPDAPAMLLYTSGTTSRPKGVIHTHNTLDAEATSIAAAHRVTEEDVILVSMPMAHVGGVLYGILLPVVAGSSAVLLDVWDGVRAADLTAEHRVTVQPGVPLFLQSILDACDGETGRLASIRLFSLGGARVTANDVRRAATQLNCWAKRSYGSTEMPTLTTGTSDGDDRLATTDGTVTGASELRIVGADGDVPVGVDGEIWCRGPELFVGYLDGSLNADAFSDDGWFRTGDLGRVDDDGYLTVTGRSKDIIIRGGENISPQEIEELLLADPRVEDVAIVAMPDPVMGERACAFVVADPSFGLDEAVTVLRGRGVATYKLPERLEPRDDLPRTPAGKIRKDVLRADAAALVLGADEALHRS